MGSFIKNTITIHGILKTMLVVVLVAIVCIYAFYQSRYLIEGPYISLESPQITIQQQQSILLEGEARNITSLMLNGREIHTDEQGVFREFLVLENGYTIMTLAAKDRYGRETSISKAFIYSPL